MFADESEINGCLSSVISLNLSDNPISSIPGTIAQLTSAMPNLQDLQMSLFREEDVEYIIHNMPSLVYLNNHFVEPASKLPTPIPKDPPLQQVDLVIGTPSFTGKEGSGAKDNLDRELEPWQARSESDQERGVLDGLQQM